MTLAENVISKFEKWVLVPLKKDIEDPERNHFNAFILLSVVIDNLASIRYQSEFPDKVKGNIGKRYQKFITSYLPAKYKDFAPVLYKDFRCKLVHAFQIQGFDVQQEETARGHHLKKLKTGDLCLHTHELLKDVLEAFQQFKSELLGPNQKSEVVAAFKNADYHGWSHTKSEAA